MQNRRNNRLLKKLTNNSIVCMMLFAAFTIIFVETVKAADPPGDVDQGIEPGNITKEEVEDLFNIILEHNFSANDTNGDGIIDEFTDPNGILIGERFVNVSGNDTVLISVFGDLDRLFLWDTEADTITEVSYRVGTVSEIVSDPENDKITVSVNVNKSDWIYIEVSDEYPEFSNLTVETDDGRIISSDMIWRENSEIFVLDDPDTIYNFTYNYTILPPIFEPENGSTFNRGKPIITITYNDPVTVIESKLNDETINLMKTNDQIYIYSPASELTNDDYVLWITVNDSNNNTRTDTFLFTIEVDGQIAEDERLTIWIIVVLAIALIILVIALFIYRWKF